jgi:hypothetical protein
MVPGKSVRQWSVAAVAAVLSMAVAGCMSMGGSSGGRSVSGEGTGRDGGGLFGLKLPTFGSDEYRTTFTIQCMEMQGGRRRALVEQWAEGLRHVAGLDAELVRVKHEPNKSLLYYGSYRGEVKPGSDQFVPPEKARQDLAMLRGLANGQMQPFQLAMIVEKPTPNPGPAEWDLHNAPGTYTLQITYCFDKPGLPNHKQVAVDICKALRDQGEEAWYYHPDERRSVVTVGHFDESAIEEGPDGNLRYSAEVLALQNKREEFKYNTECLRKVYRVIGENRLAAPSVLIEIPGESTNVQPRPERPVRNRANPFGYR